MLQDRAELAGLGPCRDDALEHIAPMGQWLDLFEFGCVDHRRDCAQRRSKGFQHAGLQGSTYPVTRRGADCPGEGI